MTSLRLARRSAERFDTLLEGDERGIIDPQVLDRQTVELLELVGAMRSVHPVEARSDFVMDLRGRLMIAAASELTVPDTAADIDRRLTVAPRRTPRERRIAMALGGFAIVGATTSMAVAAQSALPGDALYPLKRAMENAETGFRVSDDAKGQTILANASGRLDEVHQLTRDGQGNAEDIEATLNTFAEQATEASDLLLADYAQTGDESSINELRHFTAQSIAALGSLEAVIPAGAEDALLNAADVLFTIDATAAQACPTCTAEGITEIPPPLMAAGGEALDDAQQSLAGAAIVAAPAPIKPSKDPKSDQSAGAENQGGTDAPTNPVSVPPTPNNAGGGTGPGQGSDPSNGVGVNLGAPGAGGGKDDKKDKPELDEVKDVVDEVVEDVNDVVDGVGDALGGG
jgi:hypothetical protein